MKILTFLKQVPQIDQVRFDRANRIIREGIAAVPNPLDIQALGHALAERRDADEVVVVTMGPPDARGMLEDAIARGADRGILLTDRLFKGADTLATARALTTVLEREAPDLALFGRSTLDGATAQLGQQVAALADLPHVSQAVGIRRDPDDATVTVDRETEHRDETWEVAAPVAVTVLRGPEPPDPTAGLEARIEEITAEDLGGRPAEYGTRGSPTFVTEVRDREVTEPEIITELDDAARRIRRAVAESRREPAQWEPQASPTREIWVLAPRHGDGYEGNALEGLACARSLAGSLDARVTAIVLADETPSVDELLRRGADRVHVVRHPDLRSPSTAAAEGALSAALESAAEIPYALVAPWSSSARDVVPRVAARRGLGLVGDATGAEVEEGEAPRLMWIKPAWAGTVNARVICRTTPSIATLRPGSYAPLAARDDVTAGPDVVKVIDVDLPPATATGARLVSASEAVADSPLDHGDVVICVGEGASAEEAEIAAKVADEIGGGLGGTTGAVRAGLVPPQAELDIVRRSMSPPLCIAVGVHRAGDLSALRGAGVLVTIHEDRNATAHKLASLAVTAPAGAVLSRLTAH